MKNAILATCLSISCLALPSHANDRIDDRSFLEMVGALEGPDGYGTVTGFAPFQPPRDLTRMTVGEVLEYQRKIRAAGARSSAVGRYQFIWKTLHSLVRSEGVSRDRLFNGILQDRLARVLMDRCDYYSADVSTESLANCLAGQWAALPMATGHRKGRSRYEGIAGNRHLIDLQDAIAVIEARLDAPSGISLEEAFRDVQLTAVAVPLETRTSNP